METIKWIQDKSEASFEGAGGPSPPQGERKKEKKKEKKRN